MLNNLAGVPLKEGTGASFLLVVCTVFAYKPIAKFE